MQIKNICASLLACGGLMLLTGCTKDEIDPNNLVTAVPKTAHETQFDKWLAVNFLQPYNIDVQYRLNNNELDLEYHSTPMSYQQSIRFAHITKHACLEAYDEVTGSQAFVRQLFPKILQLVGSYRYNSIGNKEQGAAEGGRKISIYGLDEIDLSNVDNVNQIFQTMHHEFGHIQNQVKSYPQDFKSITSTSYVGQAWSTYWTEVEGAYTIDATIREEVASDAIKAYLAKLTELTTKIATLESEIATLKKAIEDLEVELIFASDADRPAIQAKIDAKKAELATKEAELATAQAEEKALRESVANTEDYAIWRRVNNLIEYYRAQPDGYSNLNALRAGFISAYASSSPDEDFVEVQATYIMEPQQTWEAILLMAGPGADAIKQKLAMVRTYLQDKWNIDLDKLRTIVQRRHGELSSLDLNSLDV